VLFGLCLVVVAVGAAGTVAAQDTGGDLSVDIVSNNSPVKQGDVLTVVADVTNEGSSDA
jgi:acyl-CoA hydrolase